jgi:hypothetical protein
VRVSLKPNPSLVRRFGAAKSHPVQQINPRLSQRGSDILPISKEMLLFLIDYCAWADQQMLSVCSALTPEELDVT